MDATHPHHNPVAGYGWIKRGQDREIQSNTGRQRLNINGAINTASLQAIVRYDDTINAQSTIQLFQQIEAHHPTAAWIYINIICDNARYYRSQLINDYLNDSKIKLVFLPPYAPNLNLIERYLKFFKKKPCMVTTMKLSYFSKALAKLFSQHRIITKQNYAHY